MTDIDLTEPTMDQLLQRVEALTEENRSLREYLGRVLEVLDARAAREQAEPVAAATPLAAPPDAAVRASVERVEERLIRVERAVEDVLWNLDRLDLPHPRPAAVS